MKNKLILLGIILILTRSLWAQETEPATLVPRGTLQIETGFMIENTESEGVEVKDYTYNTSLVRYGLNEYIEFRLIQEILGSRITFSDASTSKTSGLGPTIVGAKIKVAKANRFIPEMAFLGHLTFRNGSPEFSPTFICVDFRFALEYNLSDKLSMAANLGAQRDGERPNTTGIYTFVVGLSPVEDLGVYVELYGFITEQTQNNHDHRFNAGVTYNILDMVELELSAGIGLSDTSVDSFMSATASIRLFK